MSQSTFPATWRGPITTTFTPAASCLYSTFSYSWDSVLFINHFITGGESCYPSTTATVFSGPDFNHFYYSPAICPSGWHTASTLTTILSGPMAGPGTSIYLCCPLQYSATAMTTCYTTLTSGHPLTYASVEDTGLAISTTATTDTQVRCDGIPIVWQTTDLVILDLLGPTTPTSSTSSPPTNSASPAPRVSAGPDGQPGGGSSSPSTSISRGVVAGIIIGLTILVALIVLGASLLWHKRKSKEKGQINEASESGTRESDPPHELITKSNTPELLGRQKGETGKVEILTEETLDSRTNQNLGKEPTAYCANEMVIAEEKVADPQVPPLPPKIPIPPPKEPQSPVAPAAHELSPQPVASKQELDSHSSALPRQHELDSDFSALHEMDPQAQSNEVPPEWATRAELEAQRVIEIGGSPRDSQAESIPSPSSTGYSISRKPVRSPGPGSPGPSTEAGVGLSSNGNQESEETDEQEEARLKVLRDRIERIRADKERLLEIQRLSELEEETKAEILAAQRRSRPK